MHHFYIPDLAADAQRMELQGGEATHAAQVLRVRTGEEVAVLDGKGKRVFARVADASRFRVELEVLRVERVPEPSVAITLYQAITKPKSMEVIIQKATELGVHCIQPLLTERVVSRPSEADGLRKAAKWERIAIEALKQSGGAWLPRVESPIPLAHALTTQGDDGLNFLASLRPGAKQLREWLDATPGTLTGNHPARASLWIGPEGDFSPEETDTILAAGAKPITLGQTVLRSETAALCALAILNYEFASRSLNLSRHSPE